MTENAVTKTTPDGVPAPPADADNPALIDAEKTFKITVIGAILFVLSALFIILRTRMG
jgi:hypothetical protein